MPKSILNKLKKIKLVPLLLTIIAITLLIQTFIPDYQRKNWFNRLNGRLEYLKPKIATDMIKRSFSCQKEVENPDYKQYLDLINDCRKNYPIQTKNGSVLDAYMDKQDICANKYGPAPQKTTQTESICEKIVPESKWLMVWGKKLIKVKTYFY